MVNQLNRIRLMLATANKALQSSNLTFSALTIQ